MPAILSGIYTFFRLPNYPETSTFILESDKQIIITNLPKTQPTAKAKTWNTAEVRALFADPTLVSFAMIWIFHAIGGWGVSTVLPSVIYELGLTDTAVAQLMAMVRRACNHTFTVGK